LPTPRADEHTGPGDGRVSPGGGGTVVDLLERGSFRRSLHGWLDEAASGEGSFVLLAGEAGVGKIVIATDFYETVAHRAKTLTGACDPLSTHVPSSRSSTSRPCSARARAPHPRARGTKSSVPQLSDDTAAAGEADRPRVR
jgi:hypothetical protein